MAIPWKITASVNNAGALYPAWVGIKYTLYHNRPSLCNWFPLTMLVEFSAAHGFGLKLNYWPGRASTAPGGVRAWNTKKELERDSHSGTFDSRQEYKRKVKNTVTARMIGKLNTVAIASSDVRIGDLLVRDYTDEYWHVELIVKIENGVITTEAGSTPMVKPNTHSKIYINGDFAAGKKLYMNSPRRWDFNSIILTN